MKLVHLNNKKPAANFAVCLDRARVAELENDIDEAISNYQCCIKFRPHYEPAYNRLMILYRKKKEPKKEMNIITTGIKAFEALYGKAMKRTLNRTAMQLSKSLSKSMGLVDKKGKELFEQPPLPRWRQRMALLKKRYSI